MLNDSYMMGGEMHCMRLGWGRRKEIIGDHGFSIRSLRVKTLRVELEHKSDGKKKNDDEKKYKNSEKWGKWGARKQHMRTV